ncbi:maleylpyruvate isomerase family mycothiol-dependent enzyme [Streptomyces sp. NBC_01498]|uniref:maleylpyruvate isomerase family mycothiol-dependent enzyme n=1 Tax=Streptomyces sp. NBC_01498 TaxID=2975870 RepID=UPI002E7BBC75|nr:maleylpyruvate isomerase family mycothiol-dependent enzyme [Streptomyces sp. NBC_01498]WTL27432.1 maleylpyruvate isomerase family mycothiol-dependent enzyme [Streptomyces sp. NBC_01498]
MLDHVRDLESLHTATERLLTAAARLDNGSVAGPSRLPGWSRGHVLAHLARNADALVNVLEGRPMYPDTATREAEIVRDAPRTPAAQVADVRATAEHFRRVAAVPADWARTVALRNGVTDIAARVPFRRLVEVWIHHVDLDIGLELEDLPDDFTGREIDFLTERFAGHPDVPPLALSTPDGRGWRTGRADGTAVPVTGPAADLMGWLAGRRDGSALRTALSPLPVLPAL